MQNFSIKIMKKLIFIILLSIVSFIATAQNNPYQQKQSNFFYPQPGSVTTINLTDNPVQNGWAIIGSPCSGCASFFYQITRTTQVHLAENGIYYYYYYFLFFSNSYYTDGLPAPTYLTDVTFTVDGIILINTPYILIEAGIQKFGAWVRTRNINSAIRFNVTQMNVY